jgi:hypothetical protein
MLREFQEYFARSYGPQHKLADRMGIHHASARSPLDRRLVADDKNNCQTPDISRCRGAADYRRWSQAG